MSMENAFLRFDLSPMINEKSARNPSTKKYRKSTLFRVIGEEFTDECKKVIPDGGL
jgi:hypothetical protein